MASPLPCEELWHSALVNYGLERPSENTEIHVFRVILQTSLDKTACTRSVTSAGPMSDPVQTLEQIIEAWWDLEVETQNHSWKLTAVNGARSWSPNKDLLNPVYVLTRKGDPFHLQRPHGVFEVIWGHRYWVTAIALPKWINTYHCVGLLKNACGPMLSDSCAMWCDDSRLREELVECHIGSFVQAHIETAFCDLVRIDLQAALQRSMDTLHLPVKRLQDNQVMMKVFVPHGVTCYSSTTFVCISQFENWQAVLIAAGKRAYPGRNPDTMIYHRVHSSLVEVSSLFDPVTNHFILADSLRNRNIHEQLCSLFSHHAMSSLALVIGLEWLKSGTFSTCVEVTRGGRFITTTSDFGTTRCQSIMVTSLLVMSATIATLPFKLIVSGMMLLWRGLPMPQHRSPVKLLTLLRVSSHFLTLLAMTAMWGPLHLSKQGIPCSWSVEPVVNAAKVTLQKPYI